MFPKLSPLQWLVAVAFLFFYGFAVFALTRDYYLRHPPRLVAAAPRTAPNTVESDLGGRMRQALQDTEATIPAEMLAKDPALLAQEADRLFGAGRYPEAVNLYRRLLELNADDINARNDLGLALYYAGKSGEALQVLRDGTARAPDFQRIWLSLGFVASQSGDTEVARAALTKARELGPDNDIGAEAARLLNSLDQG